jgi:hypothetical protein
MCRALNQAAGVWMMIGRINKRISLAMLILLAGLTLGETASAEEKPFVPPENLTQAAEVVNLQVKGPGVILVEGMPRSQPVVIDAQMYGRGFLGNTIDSLASSVFYVWSWVSGAFSPPSAVSFAQTYTAKDPHSFASLLSDAGYKLGEIETDVGIVPTVYFKFKNVRQLSDADLVWLEQRLEKHARHHPDWISAIQRSIVETLLQINDNGEYFVSALKVRLLPLPAAEFTLEPYEGGLPQDLDVLLRAIQGRKITARRSRAVFDEED